MIIENSFVVPVEIERVWDRLLDVESVVPCIPGARIVEAVDADTWKAEMALKLGPMSLGFAGVVTIEERDAAAHRILMVAEGKDRKGKGRANMRAVQELRSVDGGTEVSLHQDIRISGAIAQFGQGVMQDVSNRMIGEFATALQASMEAPAAPAPAEAPAPPAGEATAAAAPAPGASAPAATAAAAAPAPTPPTAPRPAAAPAPAAAPISAFKLAGIAFQGMMRRLFRRERSGTR